MKKIVLLDAGPLSVLARPKHDPIRAKCRKWASDLKAAGHQIIVPEIADYEVRRELIRAKKFRSVVALDRAHIQYQYLAIDTEAMRYAADLWAYARQSGFQTAPDPSIDADVILASQAITLGVEGIIVATSNVKHVARFVAADLWTNIHP